MIKEEAKQIRKKILKQIDSLGLKVNPVQRLELAKKYVTAIKDLSVESVYIHVLNDLREDLEQLYATGKYTHENRESNNVADKARKWDKLNEKISEYYRDEFNEEENEEYGDGLIGIGEAAAKAFGYL